MFIFNLNLNKKTISRVFILTSIIIVFLIIIFSLYLIFFKKPSSCVKSNEIFEVTESNYANILKASNENINDYIGCKVKITGYVYRLLDFNQNQFVIARDMKYGKNGQSLVIGFLCNYPKASLYVDGTWIEVIGEIQKGFFNGDIAMLKIISIKECQSPQNVFVSPPDDLYIPTINMF